jgi:hypothetical protein
VDSGIEQCHALGIVPRLDIYTFLKQQLHHLPMPMSSSIIRLPNAGASIAVAL